LKKSFLTYYEKMPECPALLSGGEWLRHFFVAGVKPATTNKEATSSRWGSITSLEGNYYKMYEKKINIFLLQKVPECSAACGGN
jgi:hypothetical protein